MTNGFFDISGAMFESQADLPVFGPLAFGKGKAYTGLQRQLMRHKAPQAVPPLQMKDPDFPVIEQPFQDTAHLRFQRLRTFDFRADTKKMSWTKNKILQKCHWIPPSGINQQIGKVGLQSAMEFFKAAQRPVNQEHFSNIYPSGN